MGRSHGVSETGALGNRVCVRVLWCVRVRMCVHEKKGGKEEGERDKGRAGRDEGKRRVGRNTAPSTAQRLEGAVLIPFN